MPQMSPLLWSIFTITTIALLLTTSAFLYFINLPSPHNISPPPSHLKSSIFIWMW